MENAAHNPDQMDAREAAQYGAVDRLRQLLDTGWVFLSV